VKEFSERLRELSVKGLLRKPVTVESHDGRVITISGKRYINFSSNDYLGLTSHPLIVRAAVKALEKYGFGSGASRLLSGTYVPHKRLEERIAKFKNSGAALVFNSGYSANTGIIPAIAGKETVIFSDELNHASIVDGIRLSKARVKIYRHKDTCLLESLMRKHTSTKSGVSGQRLVVTDTVFSMDGDIAPLRDIAALCRRYDSLLLIDDAHATGVLGGTGRGGLEHFDIGTDNIIQMGTLSKALGCIGGFAAGPADFIQYLANRARSFMYSTSLPPAAAEACLKAIDLVDSKSILLRKNLWRNRRRLWRGLQALGYNTLESETPIIPILVGDINETLRIGDHLFKNNIYAPAIRPPTVPEGKCRIRFSVTAAHTKEDIERLFEVLGKLKKRFRT
jgi:8-amino-7-oxononanoate synthase